MRYLLPAFAASLTFPSDLRASQALQKQASLAITSPLASLHVRVAAPLYDFLLMPFPSRTDAAIFFVGSQLTVILTFFLSRNLRVARERAYAQTVASRGKGDAFWQAYVEEHVNPPRVDAREQRWTWDRMFSTFVGRMFLKNGACDL